MYRRGMASDASPLSRPLPLCGKNQRAVSATRLDAPYLVLPRGAAGVGDAISPWRLPLHGEFQIDRAKGAWYTEGEDDRLLEMREVAEVCEACEHGPLCFWLPFWPWG